MASRGELFRSWPFWAAMGLLLASQAVYLGLSLSALQKIHLESRQAVEKILLDDMAWRLGYTVRTGRDLHRYPRLDEEMTRILHLSRAEYFFIADTRGQVLAGRAPEAFSLPANAAADPESTFKFKVDRRMWQGRAIIGRGGEPAGYVFLNSDSPDQSQEARRMFRERRGGFLLIAAFSVILLASVLFWNRGRLAAGTPSRPKMYGLFLGPFLLAQLLFHTLGQGGDLADLYRRQNQEVAAQLARSLALDLERILDKNVPLDAIPGLDRHLEGLRRGVPLVAAIAVYDRPGRLAAEAGRAEESAPGAPAVSSPLEIKGFPAGRVEIRLSERVIRAGWVRLILDNLTMTLVAGLILLELARLIILQLRPGSGGGWPGRERGEAPTAGPVAAAARAPGESRAPPSGGAEVMRPMIFVAVFALDMSISFIPLKMAALNPEAAGLSPELLLSLPVSAEMALAGLVMISGAFWADRLGGWRPLFLAGTFLAAGGYVLSALAASPGVYILARSLAGMGYGAMNFASQIFVVDRVPPNRRGEALADLFAGFFSGGLCGCAAGGLLADRLGFSPVFLASAGIFIALGGVISLLPQTAAPTFPSTAKPGPASGRRALLQFLRARPIWNLGLLSVLPAAMALVGLVNYYLPIHLSSLGAGPAVISQLNVLFSILVVVLGPRLGRGLDGSRRPYLYLVLAGLLAVAAFPPFLVWPTAFGAVVGMVCLGLSNAISENGQPAYLLGRPETGLVGSNQALSAYNAVSRLGQVSGPMVLAAAVGWRGLPGLVWVAGLLLALTLLFWILASKAAPPE